MRITRAQLFVGIITFLTAIVAITTNFATISVPAWLKPYLWLIWPALIIQIILLVVISMVAAAPTHPPLAFDRHKFDRFVAVVSNAEQIVGIDPTLDKVERWAESLAEWEAVSEELAAMSGSDPAKIDMKHIKVVEQPAKLLLRLAKAILPALSRYGTQDQVIVLATVAYVAAKGLYQPADAAQMAYTVAQKLYQSQKYSEAAEWVISMGKNLEDVGDQSSHEQLHLMFQEMKGVIARDFVGDRKSAQQYFDCALGFANRLGDESRKAQILTHLGILKELDGHNSEAVDLYTQALECLTDKDNPELKLECYDKLARLALAQGQDDRAYHWAKQQLSLAKESLRRVHESRAHERIGWCMYKKGNLEEAYYHARQALSIEEDIKGERITTMRVFVITIADKALKRATV